MREKQIIEAIVHHWCPREHDGESFVVRTMRALLEANVAAMAARAKIEGRDFLRPHESCTPAPTSFQELLDKVPRGPQ